MQLLHEKHLIVRHNTYYHRIIKGFQKHNRHAVTT